jgi:hypothetical protein
VQSVDLAEDKDWDDWFEVSDPLCRALNRISVPVPYSKLINHIKKCAIFSDGDELILPSDLPEDGVCILYVF